MAGIGWLAGKYGLACDNLLSVDIVTADGRFLTASATANADLFWGVRGGGGNFGIVTSFEYRLYPVGPWCWGEWYSIPSTQTKAVLQLLQRVLQIDIPTNETDQRRCGFLHLIRGPIPLVAMVVCYNGPLEAGE